MAAIAALAASLIVVAVSYYRERSKAAFKLKSEHTQLSTDVIAEVNGYERLETDGGVTKYLIRADHAKTFSDNHQELQNVYIEVYDDQALTFDKMSSESALYVPEEEKNFTVYLKGNVRVETRDELKVKTNHIVYTRKTETAEIDEFVEFERGGIRGKSVGATVNMGEKRLELLKDVEIETFESVDLAKSNIRYAKINAGSASFDQMANIIDLRTNVAINIAEKNRTSDVRSERALVKFQSGGENSRQLKQFELFDDVHITSTDSGASPTNINAGYALFDKAADRYDLKRGVHIVSTANGKQTDVKAGEAIYERTAQKLALTGGAEIVQGNDHLKGDVLHANLFGDQKIRSAVIRGNASVRQVSADRTMKIAAPELNAEFGENRQLRDANAIGSSTVEIIPKESKEYTSVVTTAARGIGLIFKGEGLLENLKTDGRTTIQLNAPAGAPDAANKRVTADAVTTKFGPNGKDIQKAEAVGDAELYVEPLAADAKNYRTTINAPRFDCEFFPTGNNAKSCVAGRKAKATRVPTLPAANRGTQLISADQLIAQFSPTSNDIDTLEANTNAKFTERDLNGLAGKMTFTKADEYIRLRSGEPTVWDSRGRAKAGEIDLDTRNDRSSLRGGVSTTYYSQKQIKDATPFAASGRPVYFTADSAEFDHAAQTATYTGNARGWQDSNYVRGNQLFIDQAAGRFSANGGVQSLIHNASLKMKGKDSLVPTSASADSMVYDRNNNILQYKSNVDIRQGSDRITAGLANLYLDEKNELSKTVVENNVVITQTNRRASGDWAQYSADDDVAILRGSPAVVTDPENGSTQSGQVTFSMRDNRISIETKSRQTSQGRTRSVYKIKELQP